MNHRAFEVREFLLANGKSPFRKWLNELSQTVKARIQVRIMRFEDGNLGDVKPLGDGIWEARFIFGPGYRLYFGIHNEKLILLLAGGDKGSQRADIKKAKGYWLEFLEADDG